jgi:hypothetical protein
VTDPKLDFPQFRLRGIESGSPDVSKLVGISMMSPICRDMEKFGGHQSTRRTAAMASLPASGDAAILGYRDNARGGSCASVER